MKYRFVIKFVEKRRDELESMMAVIKAPPHTRTPLQRISRCKRRRAAAHDQRRLPKSVRTTIKTQLSGKDVSKKSTKRNKKRILDMDLPLSQIHDGELQRLHSHVWHAKRFHMITQFGWWLPLAPTEKKLRQCLKIAAGSVKGTIIWDFSYNQIFEHGIKSSACDTAIQMDEYDIIHASNIDNVESLQSERFYRYTFIVM